MVNKGKLNKFISEKPSQWLEEAERYELEKEWLDKSALIALKILRTLRSQSVTQKQLADSIGVTPQYINKVVKGHENLSLETICKIERSLGISLVSVPSYESSQVITDSFFRCSSVISRNNSKPIGSEKTEYQTTSTYEYQEEPIAA